MNLKLTSGYWRYFALLFGGMALAIVVLTYAFYLEEVKNEQQRAMIRDLHHIEIQQTILTDVLKNAFAMLTHIADLVHLLRPSTNPEGRLQLSASFVSILRTRPDFDQVRLLNKQGLEFIRVSRTQAGPRLVPDAELQDKSSRYYFRDVMRLARGQLYISPLDLNMEHGVVERPFKPVIRLAMPVFVEERKADLFVIAINLNMGNVLEHFQQANEVTDSEAYLLNQAGYFLSSPHPEWDWGFILPERHNHRFARMFPEAWRHISNQGRGQFWVGGDLFTFATVDPLEALKELQGYQISDGVSHFRYFIILRFPAVTLAHVMVQERRLFLAGGMILMLVAALLSWMLARFHMRQAQARKSLAASRRELAHIITTTPAVHYACQLEAERFMPTFVSSNLKELFGLDPDAVIGDAKWWHSNLYPDDRKRVVEGFSVALTGGKKEHACEYRFRHADGHYLWIFDNMSIERDAEGKPVEIIGSWLDITERKQAEEKIRSSLKEKEVLLRELHHRVKNNMQIISSLLKLQAAQATDTHLQAMCRESQYRIRTMSMVHEQLYGSDRLDSIRGQDYLENVVFSLVRSYSSPQRHIAVHVDAGDISLGMDEAIPCGLIINELVSNALKYAFTDEGGELTVSLSMPDDAHRLLRVYDNGSGLPPGMDIHSTKTLGLQLVDTLAEQLGGELTINCKYGMDIRILFPTGKGGKA
jgi:PAS domain S-box-containing protein